MRRVLAAILHPSMAKMGGHINYRGNFKVIDPDAFICFRPMHAWTSELRYQQTGKPGHRHTLKGGNDSIWIGMLVHGIINPSSEAKEIQGQPVVESNT